MDRLMKASLLTRLVDGLYQNGSWCGETHIQKATFFLQDLMEVPLDYEFILYKHGPFSFDLRDDLTALRADELLVLEPQARPYGPRFICTKRTRNIQTLYSRTLREYDERIAFIAKKLGNKGVAELERLATALYVTKPVNPSDSADDRAEQICRLKPHISPESARNSINETDLIAEEAREIIH